MPATETQRLDDMMRKVEAMLATAESVNDTNPEMAANYRANAERVMLKYRIAQEDLIARGGELTDQFGIQFHDVTAYALGSEFADVYRSLLSYVANHVGARLVWNGYTKVEEQTFRIGTLVGYEADIRYAEVLFLNARLVFADRMEPKRDANLSDEDNVYRMRMAGMERSRIGLIMGWGGEGTKGPGKATTMFKRACKARGEDASALLGKGNNVKNFRSVYGDEFKTTIWYRLWDARMALEKESGGIELHGREDRVNEAVYGRWPNLRPIPAERSIGEEPKRSAARQAADERRWQKEAEKRAAKKYTRAGQAGARAGKAAADEVAINKGATTRRIDK